MAVDLAVSIPAILSLWGLGPRAKHRSA